MNIVGSIIGVGVMSFGVVITGWILVRTFDREIGTAVVYVGIVV